MEDVPHNTHEHHSTMPAATAMAQESTGLDVAGSQMQMVVDDTKHIKRQRARNRCIWISIVVLVCVLSALVVGLTVSLLRRDSNDNNIRIGMDTDAPTAAPAINLDLSPSGLSLYESVRDKLLQDGISGETDLMTIGSSQSQAIEYMVSTNEPSLMGYVNDSFPSDLVRLKLMERYALLVFYFASNGPTTWTERDTINFADPTKDVCRWQGEANMTTGQDPMGIQCVTDAITVSSIEIRE